MLFSGEDGLKPTAGLSGGETARLLMSRLMLQKHPVLVFDEPTNHLDLEAVNALGEGLSLFPGTVLPVSHDRDLISDVATRVLSFTPQGLIDFPGTYEEYLEKYPMPEASHNGKAGKW
jgi:ATPase subunit of ABC transporter with duplicated ATPase domains